MELTGQMWLLLAWLFLTSPGPEPSFKSLSVVRQGVLDLRVAGTRAVLVEDERVRVVGLPGWTTEWELPLEGRRLEAFDGGSLALSKDSLVEWWDVRTHRRLLSRSFAAPAWVGLGRGRLLVISSGLWFHVVDPRGSERRVQLEDPVFRRTFEGGVQMAVLSGDHGSLLYNLIYAGGSRLVLLDLNTQQATRLAPGRYFSSHDGSFLACEGSSICALHETLEFGPPVATWSGTCFDAGGGRLAFCHDGSLELLDLAQGTVRRYTDVPALSSLGVSERGECVVLTQDHSLYRIP